jgi:hypothetical protein
MEVSIRVFWRPTLDAADQEIRFAREMGPSYDVPVVGEHFALDEDRTLAFPVKAVEWQGGQATVELTLTEQDIAIDELKRVGFRPWPRAVALSPRGRAGGQAARHA